jgi:hypothetical protein
VLPFIEWIVGPLHAAIEKVAGIGSLAEVGQFRVATVDREIGGRGGVVAVDQPRAKAYRVANRRADHTGRGPSRGSVYEAQRQSIYEELGKRPMYSFAYFDKWQTLPARLEKHISPSSGPLYG